MSFPLFLYLIFAAYMLDVPHIISHLCAAICASFHAGLMPDYAAARHERLISLL